MLKGIDAKHPLRKVLVIQTVGFGDHILSTALLETLHAHYPEAELDVLIKRGNEPFYRGNPLVKNMWVWNKQERKYSDLFRLLKVIRGQRYDLVVNVHRYISLGLLTLFSGARVKVGFDRSPVSMFFDHVAEYGFQKPDGSPVHEIERNHELIRPLVSGPPKRPRLYPGPEDFEAVKGYTGGPYICIGVAGSKFSNSLPPEQWVDLIRALPEKYTVYLLGGIPEKPACDRIREAVASDRVVVLAGKLSLIQSAALMKDAAMTYACDSSPLHMASAMNAPVGAVFMSTNIWNGFGPLSDRSVVVETREALDCRPCTTHGRKFCPKGHFACAKTITTAQLLEALERNTRP